MEEKAKNIIELKNICKVYDDNGFKAVDDFNLEVKRGEFVTFLGPSGCGKTTTLRMIAGFEMPSSGKILLNGEDISQLPANKRPINTVFQRYALFPHMNIYDNIAFGLKLKKLSKDEIKKKVKRVLSIVDLEGFENRKISTLSGGQQQRLCIARALAVEPEVILMDEPTSALDPISTSRIEDLAIELKKEYTIVMVTHNMQQATRISDKTAFFLLGELIEYGDTEQLFSMPKQKKTEDYITGRFG